jgi:tetratricopeptide (TPR) repeat protein
MDIEFVLSEIAKIARRRSETAHGMYVDGLRTSGDQAMRQASATVPPGPLYVFWRMALFCLLMACVTVRAANLPATPHSEVKDVGKVHFSTSCSPRVQRTFDTGVALLHSFQYDLARRVFEKVARGDPHCAMAYWGQALSLYHPLWVWPNAQTLQQGHSDMDTAERLGAKTEREGAYIRAAAIYYRDDSAISTAARAIAYSDAMAEVCQHYPEDSNAAALYALSLIAVRSADKAANVSRRMKAIDILNELYLKEPDNPGVTHYLIHATDTPELAHLGLTAARHYALIAPDAPHALHMPSHIFTELGMWQESIRSNLASAVVAEKNTKSDIDNESGDQIHALSFLQYAFLQTGRGAAARSIIDEVKKVPGANIEDITNGKAMLEAAYFEEMHDWKGAAALVPEPNSYPMIQVLGFAVRAVGEARTGDTAGATADMEKLHDATKAMKVAMKGMGMMAGGQDSAETLSELEAEAWLAFATGNADLAFAKMKTAAEGGGSSMRMSGLPGVPAREMLGDLLLELHRPAEALEAYQSVLKVSPNRFDSLYGAARAAQVSGDMVVAKRYFGQLKGICGTGADRVELKDQVFAVMKSSK